MTYTITAVRRIEETVWTDVTFDFNGTIVMVEVPHFRPQSVNEVKQNIKNRALSEKDKLDAGTLAQSFLANIPLNQTTQLP